MAGCCLLFFLLFFVQHLVNNFSVMLGLSHRFMDIYQSFWGALGVLLKEQ